MKAHIAVAAFENAPTAGFLREERIDVVPEAFRTRGEDFNGVDIRVLVDDAARDAVIFRVDQAERAEFVRNVESAVLAPCNGAVQDCGKIFAGDWRLVAERPETPADLGTGGISGESEEVSAVRIDFNGVAHLRIAEDFIDCAAENPGVPAEC